MRRRSGRPLLIGVLSAALLCLILWPIWGKKPEPVGGLSGRPTVIDGDTLELSGERIRLWGIDAPEASQTCQQREQPVPCGQIATRALIEYLGQQAVNCTAEDVDRYGRIVARCQVGPQDLGAWMVEQGQALAYREYGGDAYDAEEAAAQAARRGVWAGSFVPPWDYRLARR